MTPTPRPAELVELLPCPWCGERPTIANIRADENQGTKWGGVVCCTPEVRTHYEPVEKWAERAIEAWNDRAALSAHGQPVVDASTASLPPLPQAFFDEFGVGADDRVQDYARAAIAALTGADHE